MCVCVCERQRSSCLTIDRPAIGWCGHMSKKGWTMYPWCSTCWWISRSWSLSLVSELPLSGSQVRTLSCQCCCGKLKPLLVINLEINCCLKKSFLIPDEKSYFHIWIVFGANIFKSLFPKSSPQLSINVTELHHTAVNAYIMHVITLNILCFDLKCTQY